MKAGKNCHCHCHYAEAEGYVVMHFAACCDGIDVPDPNDRPCTWCLDDDCRGGCLL